MKTYETDAAAFPHDAYTVAGWGRGIAFYVRGWQLEPAPNEWQSEGETECPECDGERCESGPENDRGTIEYATDCHACGGTGLYHHWTNPGGKEQQRTGQVIVTMIGDDARHVVDPDDLTPLAETDYCHSCGQIGCGHNVPDAEELP